MNTYWVNRAWLKALRWRYVALEMWRRRRKSVAAARTVRSDFYRSLWRQAALATGAEIEELGYEVLRIRRGAVVTHLRQNYVPVDHHVALMIAGNKPLSYRLLTEHGVRVPPYSRFTLDTVSEAYAFLAGRRGPCVVKPGLDTGGGVGVTTGLQSPRQVRRAAALASVYSRELLIQEQVPGCCYRLLYLDGELLDAVRQMPPSVIGDGTRTIAQLIQRLNEGRLQFGALRGQGLVTIDVELEYTLRAQGLKLSFVPRSGQAVVLKTAVNENGGADNHSATADLCPSLIAEGARAAHAVGARLAGVDVVTTNPAVPLAQSGGAVIEVNTTPGLYWHYRNAEGVCPIADHLLEVLLAEAASDSFADPQLPKPNHCAHLEPVF